MPVCQRTYKTHPELATYSSATLGDHQKLVKIELEYR
jgi:hypothetical protein